MKQTTLGLLLILGLGVLPGAITAHAQPDSAPRQDFWITDGPVLSMVETNGVIYVGGLFKSVAPNAGRGALLNIFSGESAPLLPQANGAILSVVPDGTGGWFLGGLFTTVGGVARTNLARLLPDLTVDPAWTPNPHGFATATQPSGVYALAQVSNVLYVGGIFTNIGGIGRSNLAALDATTGAALSWTGSVAGEVYALATASNRLFLGGRFDSVAGATRTNLAAVDRFTGAVLPWTANVSRQLPPSIACVTVPFVDNTVNAFAVNGNTLYVGGYFTNIGGVSRTNLAALDVNTATVQNWQVPTGDGVQALAYFCNTLYLGGAFTNVAGQPRQFLAAADTQTGVVTPWNPDPDAEVFSLLVAGNTVYVGGFFLSVGGQPRDSLAAVDLATGQPAPWSPRAGRGVLALALAGNHLFAGPGGSAGGLARRNLAAFDAATGQPLDWNPGANGIVWALAATSNAVYAGGSFTWLGGAQRLRLGAVHPVTGAALSWQADATGLEPDTVVYTLALRTNALYAGGYFSALKGSSRASAGALDLTTGTPLASWAPFFYYTIFGFDFYVPVTSLAATDNSIYAGGGFNRVNNSATVRSYIAEVSASTGAATSWAPAANDVVLGLAVDATNVYAGGCFTTMAGLARPHAAAILRSTGAAYTNWNADVGGGISPAVYSLIAVSNRVYLGGGFATVGGQPRQALAIVDTTNGALTAFNANLGDLRATVYAMSATGTRLTAGGLFVTVGDEVRSGIASFVESGFPRIFQQPAPQNVPLGQGAMFGIMASGQAPLAYQWQFNGTNLAGATNSSYTVASAQFNNAGPYRVLVSNALGRATSIDAILTPLVSVSITTQPTGQTVAPGTNVTLSVVADGNPPPSYQWRLNGVNIPGAVYSSLTLSNVAVTNSGRYTVVVSGVGGTVESDVAELVVTAPALAFADAFASRGTISGLSGTGSGTNATATREAGEARHAGKRGGASLWLSWTAPGNGIAIFHTRGSAFDTLLAVYTNTTVSGTNVVAGDEDRGGYLTSLAAFNALAGQEYQIAVDGFFAATGRVVLSWNLETTADELPRILVHPQNLTLTTGATATFDVTATSQTPLNYQWLYNCMTIPGATNQTLVVSNVSPADVGIYSVRVGNSVRTNESLAGALEIGADPDVVGYDKLEDLLEAIGAVAPQGLLVGPLAAGATFSAGGTILVSAGTIGSQLLDTTGATTQPGEPLHCEVPYEGSLWYSLTPETSGVLILDTIGSDIDTVLAVYVRTNVGGFETYARVACDNNSAPDGARSLLRFDGVGGTNYQVVVAGVNGQRGAATLNWRLGTPPAFTQSLLNTIGLVDGSVTFDATGTAGTPAPSYQWRFNGVPLPGQTNATLSLNNLQTAQAGYYDVVASNFVEVVTNSFAALMLMNADALLTTGDQFTWQLFGVPGQSYVLEMRTNLPAGTWEPADTNLAAGNGLLTLTNGPLTGITNRTYRLRLGP